MICDQLTNKYQPVVWYKGLKLDSRNRSNRPFLWRMFAIHMIHMH